MNQGEPSAGTIRIATAKDHDAIQALVNEAFRIECTIKKNGGERLDAAGEELRSLMARGTFLALEQDGLIATVYVEPRGERCYLGLLSILPSRQGEGLGRRMMVAAEAFAKERGCAWIDLRVISPRMEALVPVYQRLGYSEHGRQEYPAHVADLMLQPGYFLVMSKRL